MFQSYKLGKIEKQTAPQLSTAQQLSNECWHLRSLSIESKLENSERIKGNVQMPSLGNKN